MNELDRAAAELLGLEYDSNAEEVLARIPSSRQWVSWHPCTDLNQAAMVVAEINRRGLLDEWLSAMARLCPLLESDDSPQKIYEHWLATAPAAARVRAALEASKACGE